MPRKPTTSLAFFGDGRLWYVYRLSV